MEYTIRTTPKVETVEVLSEYGIIESNDFIYIVLADTMVENDWLDEEALSENCDLYYAADIVIRKSDRVVTKARFF